MAESQRQYVYGAFVSSLLCVILVVVAFSTDAWVSSSAYTTGQVGDSTIKYGLFGGQIVLRNLITPSYNTLYMTCISEVNACALSCKTTEDARLTEVRALANGYRPSVGCLSTTTVTTTDPLETPPVISFAFYVSLIAVLAIELLLAVIIAGLAILNATKNPTEPLLGLPGCLWTNIATALIGLAVLLMFGVYWAASGLNEHLAVSYVALGFFQPKPGLGYSYWFLLVAFLCPVANVVLIQVRAYVLERDPPPPTIKVENHSDGTIFLY